MAGRGSIRQRTGRLVLVGAPVEAGAYGSGSRLGPSALRRAGLERMLDQLGCDVVDHGDVAPVVGLQRGVGPEDDKARKLSEAARWISSLSDAAYEIARDGHLPVFLGGDHSLSMGTVRGVARARVDRGRDLFVLWLDAHPDFNTPANSPSGNLHGMSLAYLCGEPGFERVMSPPAGAVVNPSNVFLLGIRSLDPGEGEALRARGVNFTHMRALREQGLAAPIRRVLGMVAERSGVLHVSLDADSVDPTLVPGVNVPVPGGATYAEASLIMQMLGESGLVGSLDVAEFNPLLDADDRSARVIAKLVANLFYRKSRDRHDHQTRKRRHAPDAVQPH